MHRSVILAWCAVLWAAVDYAGEESPPVVVRVVDEASGRPVTRFTYDYTIDSPDRHAYSERKEDVEVNAADGTATIPAPRRLSLWISVTSPRHLPASDEFKVLPGDTKRTFELKLTPGATVRGTVRDNKTERPVEGAAVMPKYFGHPFPRTDRKRAVKSGADGRFELGGVDLEYGIYAEREGYRSFDGRMAASTDRKNIDTTVWLDPASPDKPTPADATRHPPRLFGRVTDFAGRPVGPYRVVAAAMQDPDALIGNKEYYFEEEAKYIPAGQSWKLKLYSDAKRYWVMAQAPGFAPAAQVVAHRDIGRPIELRLHKGVSLSGKVEGTGVAQGKAVVMVQPMYLFDSNPANEHHHDSPLHKIQVSRVAVGADGLFRFDHLAPDTYLVQAIAAGATAVERLVTVSDRDVHIPEPLRLIPAGRIAGVLFDRDGKPKVLESGNWSTTLSLDPDVGKAIWGKYHSVGASVSFTTDERGGFLLDNAPAGRNLVGFNYPITSDVIGSHDHAVQVLPGRVSEVRVNVPEKSPLCWKLPVEVVVGKGSRSDVLAGACVNNPEFFKPPSYSEPETLGIYLAFEPLPGQALSWPTDADSLFVAIPSKGGVGRATITGVHPGHYRVIGSTQRRGLSELLRPLVDQKIQVKANMTEPIRIRLPAASIEVDWQHPREDAKQWGVTLIALGEDGKPLREQFANYGGGIFGERAHLRPALEFMPPGRYTLLVWRDGLGWARSKPVVVEEGKIAYAGVLKFQPGGTLRGRLPLPPVCTLPERVVAVDSRGVCVAAEDKWTHEGYTFVADDLWPEKWTVAVLDRDRRVIVEKTVELKGTETVPFP